MIMPMPSDMPGLPEDSKSGNLLGQSEAVEWLENARAWCPQSGITWIEKLRKDGIKLPDPDHLSDQHLPAMIRRLVLSLAERGLYVMHTDHLADAAFYQYMVETALAVPAPPRHPGAFEVIDLCPPYGAGIELMLACYATDEAREAFQAEGVAIPPRKPLVCDRDRTLPKPPGVEGVS
ncbi:MAG: hypothetical protein GY894_08605 [Planctomycetes bacterium]|nr:hypothetical protein [Planctomycetota bacterium]